jgi:hypothetical protein
MGIFDALSGRIGHFNDIAVPVLNNIFTRISATSDKIEKQLFIQALVISEQSIDLFFKPGAGPALRDVKEYNKKDFEKLHAIFIIWVSYDYCNLGLLEKSKVQSRLADILGIDNETLSRYLEQLIHGSENPIGLDRLWDEIAKVIHTMPNTRENYLVFAREFSKICSTILKERTT